MPDGAADIAFDVGALVLLSPCAGVVVDRGDQPEGADLNQVVQARAGELAMQRFRYRPDEA